MTFKRYYPQRVANFMFAVLMILLSAHCWGQSALSVSVTTTVNKDCDGGCFYDGPTILINEIMLAPKTGDGSIYDDGTYNLSYNRQGEWIELYNPHKCEAVDISCYFLGNNANEGTGNKPQGGGFSIPPGTIVPPQGFCVVRGYNAPEVPRELLVENGGNVVEVVVEDRVCLDESPRLWFPNSGGWFAFYDANGVPQDAVSWGTYGNSCMNCRPCTPMTSDCDYTGELASYEEIPADRRSVIMEYPITYADDWMSYGRIPDGGEWKPDLIAETIGKCNTDCVPPIIKTCNGTATAEVTGGKPPYTYRWDDDLMQTTATATGLCAGIYTVTVKDADGAEFVQKCEVLDNEPEITHPDTGYCFTTEPVRLPGGYPAGGYYEGNRVTDSLYLNAQPGKDSYNVDYVYKDEFGCVGRKTVKVDIYPILHTSVNDKGCYNVAYRENGFDIDSSRTMMTGVLHDTIVLQSVHGCDSVVVLNLTIEYCDPELAVMPDSSEYVSDCDSVAVYLRYQASKTSSPMIPPYYVTVYKNQYGGAVLKTESVEDTLWPGGERTFVFRMDPNDLLTNFPLDAVSIAINDDGQGVGVAKREKNPDNNVYTVPLTFEAPDIEIVDETNTLCEEYVTTLTANGQYEEIQWLPNGETTPSISVTEPGLYTAIANNGVVCYDTAIYMVNYCPCTVTAANVFTPNNDGYNDVFSLVTDHDIEALTLTIFDRWGQKVYKEKNIEASWDGTTLGKPAVSGVYYYVIDYYCKSAPEEKKSIHGSVTLLR